MFSCSKTFSEWFLYLLIHFLGTYNDTPKFYQMELRAIVICDLLAASIYPQLPLLTNNEKAKFFNMFFLEFETISDSCSFCGAIPLEYRLSFSNLSGEQSLHPVSIQIKENEISIGDVLMGNYVSCLHEKEWYDGILEELSVEDNVLVKFLHPTGPLYLH